MKPIHFVALFAVVVLAVHTANMWTLKMVEEADRKKEIDQLLITADQNT